MRGLRQQVWLDHPAKDHVRLFLAAGRMGGDIEPYLNHVGGRHAVRMDDGAKHRFAGYGLAQDDVGQLSRFGRHQTLPRGQVCGREARNIHVRRHALNKSESESIRGCKQRETGPTAVYNPTKLFVWIGSKQKPHRDFARALQCRRLPSSEEIATTNQSDV